MRGGVEQLARRAGGRREADFRAGGGAAATGEEGREVGFEAGGGGLFEGLLEVVEVVGEDVGGGVDQLGRGGVGGGLVEVLFWVVYAED